MPPIPVLPAPILPQQVHLLVGSPHFQALDRFIARHYLAAEGHIEGDLAAEEAETAHIPPDLVVDGSPHTVRALTP